MGQQQRRWGLVGGVCTQSLSWLASSWLASLALARRFTASAGGPPPLRSQTCQVPAVPCLGSLGKEGRPLESGDISPLDHHGTPPRRAALVGPMPCLCCQEPSFRLAPRTLDPGADEEKSRGSPAQEERIRRAMRLAPGSSSRVIVPPALLNPGVHARSARAAGGRWPAAGHGQPGGEAQRPRGQRHQAGQPGSAGCRPPAGSLALEPAALGSLSLGPPPPRPQHTLVPLLPGQEVGSQSSRKPGSGDSLPAASLSPSQRGRPLT